LGVPAIDTPVLDGVIVKQLGNVPLVNFQVYGGMPPEAANSREYAVPTLPDPNTGLVIAGCAGTVIVALAVLLVSAIDVTVTVAVTAELDGAGAV
jgi:hypothetical protein